MIITIMKQINKIVISDDRYTIVLRGKRMTSISNWKKTIIDPYVKEIIKNGSMEIDLVNLVVLFKAIGRIESMTSVDKIFNHVRSMSREISYYWYSEIINYQNVKDLRNKILN